MTATATSRSGAEKEALSGIIWDAASDYDVPVIVSKGMPSLTQVYGSFAKHPARRRGWKTLLPVSIRRSRSDRLSDPQKSGSAARWNSAKSPIVRSPIVERVALTEGANRAISAADSADQARRQHPRQELRLAIALNSTRCLARRSASMVRECIAQHISEQQLEILREAERSEREVLEQLAWEQRQ